MERELMVRLCECAEQLFLDGTESIGARNVLFHFYFFDNNKFEYQDTIW